MQNKTILVIVVLLSLGLAYLWQQGQKTVEISTQIDIAATPEQVWHVLSDIDAWAQWSPIINQSQGVAVKDSVLTITMVGEESSLDGPIYQPKIIELDAPRYLRWNAVMMTSVLLANDKVLELQATNNGTRLIHKELFKGMFVPIFSSRFKENVPPMLNAMNQALKKQVE